MSGVPCMCFRNKKIKLMFVWLIILTTILVLAFVIALIILVRKILDLLVNIGGNGNSFLSKLRLGLRAIEKETSHLPGNVIRLNKTLSDTGDGLKILDTHLEGTIQAALKQKVV